MSALICFINQKDISFSVDSRYTYGNGGYDDNKKKIFSNSSKNFVVIQLNNPWYRDVQINEIMLAFEKYLNGFEIKTLKECYDQFIEFLHDTTLILFKNIEDSNPMTLVFIGFDNNGSSSILEADFTYSQQVITFEIKHEYTFNAEPFFFYSGDKIEYAVSYLSSNSRSIADIITLCDTGQSKFLNSVHSNFVVLKQTPYGQYEICNFS